MEKNNELTTNEYWDKMYVSGEESTHTVSLGLNLASKEVDHYLKKFLPKGNGTGQCIEIGCAPGSWMHYFYTEHQYQVSGLDYTEHGVDLTKKNMQLLGINASVYHQDIFQNSLEKGFYDVVFSSGFIEHFENPFPSIKAHSDLVKRGGYLILKIPNLRGFNGWLQRRLDRGIYDKHNVEMMRKSYFSEILKQDTSLDIVDISYVGKVNFCLFIGGKMWMVLLQGLQLMFSLLYKITGRKFFPVGDSSYLSPYVIAIYKKRS